MARSPDYIVIGAMKCGTSTVCAYLEDHPQSFMLPRAEPNFFSDPAAFPDRVGDYAALFADVPHTMRVVGEGSNNYSWSTRYPETAARIAAYRSDMRIVYIVRHPIDRIVSAWIQKRVDSRDAVPPSLDRAVIEQSDFFVGQSLYWQTLSRYRAVFPDAQIFLGFMEDLKSDPAKFYDDLCKFLDIDPRPMAARSHLNESRGKRVPTETYTRVNALPAIAALKTLLPGRLKHAMRERFFSRPLEVRPELSSKVRDHLSDLLRPDAAHLLAHAGKPTDFWRWD